MSDLARLTGVEPYDSPADPLLAMAKITRRQYRRDGAIIECDHYEWRFDMVNHEQLRDALGASCFLFWRVRDVPSLTLVMGRIPNAFKAETFHDPATMETVWEVWATLPESVVCEVVD